MKPDNVSSCKPIYTLQLKPAFVHFVDRFPVSQELQADIKMIPQGSNSRKTQNYKSGNGRVQLLPPICLTVN